MATLESNADHQVACFSSTRDETAKFSDVGVTSVFGAAKDRMWAQYGDGHKGICLAFDRTQLEAHARELGGGDRTIHYGNVAYRDDVEYTTFKAGREHGTDFRRRFIEWESENRVVHHFTKRQDWESEAEYRILLLDYSGKKGGQVFVPWGAALRFLFVGALFDDALVPKLESFCKLYGVPAHRYMLQGRRATLVPYVD